MNADELKGNWKQMTGKMKSEWGRLTDDDLQAAEGDREQLIGKIQERYGKERGEAEREVDDWLSKN